MSGYGYGEAKRARRDRGASSSRSTPRAPAPSPAVAAPQAAPAEKRPKGKKEKKEKKHRDPDDPRARKRAARSRSQRRGGAEGAPPPPPQQASPVVEEAVLGRTPSRTAVVLDVPPVRRSAWREEIAARGEDNDDDGNMGIAPVEDDEEVERKLAESRARREALIAKWVNRGESQNGLTGTLETPDTPLADGASSESEGEVSGDDRPDVSLDNEAPDEETLQLKRDLQRFILRHKAEHDDDMFQENADEDALKAGHRQSTAISQTGASADDWDDTEGYYKAKIGEVMAGRYLVVEDMCGKGVFSNVVKAKDQQENCLVAVKIMRCNDMMRKAAEKEVQVLDRLNRADKGNRRHVIRLIRHFGYRGHLCLVFECMWDNLRVALKKYTKDKGMSLQAVRAYTRQLLVALRHVHRCHIIHADIKPDNILISAGHNVVKICDLGSAMDLTEVDVTPYLVSRFYRAPEIVLGKEYTAAVDVFAMGSTLYELFTGKILFPGRTNNDMMRLYMEVKGKLPHKMIKSGQLWKQHFDENLDFKYQDTNKATRKKITRVITDLSQKRAILDMVMQRVGPEKQKSTDPEDMLYVRKAKQFADLMNQMTALDPDKRVTPQDALQHPFVAEAGPGSKKDTKNLAHKR
mmetsp:Transcript_80003/g.226494  ORF Transcript_80003/g.226494 Transcript_80003/m.226494 type:complete len:634 (-) Transcript_80003:108-2009(-)